MSADPWRQFLERIGRIPLLTRSEVIDACRQVRRGEAARCRLDTAPTPSAVEVTALAAEVADGEQARDLLVTSNLRLVVSIARRYRVGSLPLPDLVQEGAFGLMRAVDKFDQERGIAFSTYASWWIRQAVSQAVAEHARSVRVPKHVGHDMAACVRTREELTDRLGHRPSAAQVAAALGADTAQVEIMLRSAASAYSLQRLGGDVHEVCDGLLTGTDEGQYRAEQSELRERLGAALLRLPPAHRAVLRDRVGWSDGCPRSLRSVATTYGITRDAARQLEREAREMLRQLPQLDGLRQWEAV